MIYDKERLKIEKYPDDVYTAVGIIIKAAQEWEEDYKELAFKLNIPVKKIGNSSLNKLNEALKKENLISKKEFEQLREVIRVRNYINHDFFLTDFKTDNDNYVQYIENLQAKLNASLFLIYEATDLINNKIDSLNGDDVMRPTVFD